MKKGSIFFIVFSLIILFFGSYFILNKLIENRAKQIQESELQKAEEKRLKVEIASTTTAIEVLKKELGNIKEENKKQIDKLIQKNTPTKTTLSNSEIISKNKPAVVFIQTPSGSGSGMIISSDGIILTNAHVVIGVKEAVIKLADERVFSALIVGRDEDLDVALLKMSDINFPYVELGDSTLVKQGDNIFTFGFPFGLEGEVSFKEGTISRQLASDGANYIEISAEIHGGNSGGPLVNDKGQVIGINTAKYGIGVNGVLLGETLKFAIPINEAKNKIAQLKSGEENLKWLATRASGLMTIFNETSEQAKLIKNTRFESQDGKIFRISQSINVPGKTNGNPGTYEVMIFADNTGSEYNIYPTKFTIPGFKGNPDHYFSIYGRSYQSTSGGN